MMRWQRQNAVSQEGRLLRQLTPFKRAAARVEPMTNWNMDPHTSHLPGSGDGLHTL